MAGVHTTVFITGANVLIRVYQDILGLVPVNASLVGQNWDIDFVEDFLVTSESGITPSGNGAVSIIGSVVWWWHVVGETDRPDILVELDIFGCLQNANIVDDLSR